MIAIDREQTAYRSQLTPFLGGERLTRPYFSEDAAEEKFLKDYFSEIKRNPVLNFPQQQCVFRFYTDNLPLSKLRLNQEFLGTIEADQRETMAYALATSADIEDFITRCNQGLVAKVAHKYGRGRATLYPRLQLGNIGLVGAIRGFDYTLGYYFSTYAVPGIRLGILSGLRNMKEQDPGVLHFGETVYASSFADQKGVTLGDVVANTVPDSIDDLERRKRLAKIKPILLRALSKLTPEELEAVQDHFELDIHQPQLQTSGRNPESAYEKYRKILLIQSAFDKLRKEPGVQALIPGEKRSNGLIGNLAEGNNVSRDAEVSGTMPVSETMPITDMTIKAVMAYWYQRSNRHGGLNFTQIGKRLGITAEDVKKIINSEETRLAVVVKTHAL